MAKNETILNWLLTCPTFANRLSFLSAETVGGENVLLPFGTSSKSSFDGYIDVDGLFNGKKSEEALIYEEYQVQMFRYTIANQNAENIATFEEVQEVIDWIIEQDNLLNFPDLPNCVGVDCLPFIPQVAGRDVETGLWKYFFTLRIYYKNTLRGRYLDEG